MRTAHVLMLMHLDSCVRSFRGMSVCGNHWFEEDAEFFRDMCVLTFKQFCHTVRVLAVVEAAYVVEVIAVVQVVDDVAVIW